MADKKVTEKPSEPLWRSYEVKTKGDFRVLVAAVSFITNEEARTVSFYGVPTEEDDEMIDHQIAFFWDVYFVREVQA